MLEPRYDIETVLRPRTERARRMLEEWGPAVREKAPQWARTVENWMAKSPGVGLAVALGTGVALGWLIKRR